jgi:transposase
MFLRSTTRKKDGKEHRYYSVVESVRSGPAARPHQRTLLYLGEINSEQQADWAKAIEVFDTRSASQQTFSLFPSHKPLPPDLSRPVLQIRVDQYELARPRQYGACWLGCELWRSLKLDEFWGPKLGLSREGTDWTSLLQVSAIYRLIAPGSEWRLHRQWYDQSAMKDLLAGHLQWGGKDQLYEVLDKLLEHRQALFTHLQSRWKDLFGMKYEVLLYDLTSTYFEGEAEQNPKAQRGYSRDHRPDCKQVVIALVVTPEGFPLAYETLPGNTLDKQTLLGCVEKIQARYGTAERIWIMDRGIPTEAQLQEIQQKYPQLKYLVGTPRSQVKETRPLWEKLAWRKIRDTVEVKSFADSGEFYVVAKSDGRQLKEMAMRRRRLAKLLRALRKMRPEKSRDRLLMRVGAARSAAKSAKSFVTIELPKVEEEISRQTFRFKLQKEKLRDAELYDGHYLLRSNLSGQEPKQAWELYILLVEIEAVFRSFKNDLGIRPIYHQLEARVDAHIFVCFQAYCLYVTLKHWLKPLASGLTPRQALEEFAKVQMLDVVFPTTDRRKLVMSRYTQPDDGLRLLMARMKKEFGEQPPPKLVSTGDEGQVGLAKL